MISTIQKFITFNDDKLVINNLDLPKSKPVYVLSIIGKARTGKSTLLNCILSFLFKDTIIETNIFQTSDSDEHCTHGVDACYITFDDKTLLILDVQGIEYHDSSLDTKMLLIIYLISNLIIFNEKNLISNATLHSLLPLTTFISCLELSSFDKPNIIFRIADCDLTLEAKEHLNKTLIFRKDQYQNIRETIKELFKSIDCLTTASLDRTEKKLLKQNKYFGFLENDENNFKISCNTIINNLVSCVNKFNSESYVDLINSYSKNINENKKIDYKKLDINFQIAKNEILEWIKDNINEKYYLNVIVNGTQKQYLDKVAPIKNYFDNVLQKFKERFVNINSSIKDSYYNDVQTKYLEVYNDALSQTISKATVNINNNIECAFNNSSLGDTIKIYDKNFTNELIDEFIININSSKEINLYHSDTKNNIIEKLKVSLNNICDEFNEFKSEFYKMIDNINKNNLDKLELARLSSWEHIVEYIEDFKLDFNSIKINLLDFFTNKYLLSTDIMTSCYELNIDQSLNFDKSLNFDQSLKFTIKKFNEKYNAEKEINKQIIIKIYDEYLKTLEQDFNNHRNLIARCILKSYNNQSKFVGANYGKYKDDTYKYPTYNLELLHDCARSNNISNKLYFISFKLNDVFTKLYILDDILNLSFLNDYFVEECTRVKLKQYYLLLVSVNNETFTKNNDDNNKSYTYDMKDIISHKYIDILFDIIIMDIQVDDVCYKL